MSDKPASITEEEKQRVRDAAHKLALQAPGMVGDHPIHAVAALTLAAVHAAVLTDSTWEQFLELSQAYWEAASLAIAVEQAREGGAIVFPVSKKEGSS